MQSGRRVLGILIFACWALILDRTRGHSVETAPFIVGLFGLSFFILPWRGTPAHGETEARFGERFLFQLLLAAFAVETLSPLFLGTSEAGVFSRRFGVGGLFLALALGSVWVWLPRYTWLCEAAIVLKFLLALRIPAISPAPGIDVFVNNTQGVDYFLAGLNPYSQAYVDIYGGRYGYEPGFLYFPGLLLILAPFRVLFGDIRYAGILAHYVGCFVLSRLGGRSTASQSYARIAALLWAFLPVQHFVFEQAWTDPLLVGGIGLVLWVGQHPRLNSSRWVTFLSGFTLTLKQYAFPPLFYIGFRDMLRARALLPGIRRVLHGFIPLASLAIPFLLLDADGFFKMTVLSQVSSPSRLDSMNWTSWWLTQGGHWPAAAQVVLSGAGMGIGALLIARGGGAPPENRMHAVTAALYVGYGFSFLFGRWAFCNYHYLLLFFLVALLTPGKGNVGFSR